MTEKRKPQLRWRKPTPPTGLARSTWTGGDSRELTLGGERIGTVACLRESRFDEPTGWFWYAAAGDHRRNTASTPVATREEAQAQAVEWVRARLAESAVQS